MIKLSAEDLAILRLYNEPHRHYHTAFHIIELLELHETGRTRGIDIPDYQRPDFGGMTEDFISAVVAHDCVYEIGKDKGFNERASLHRWQATTGRYEAIRSGIVQPLILATIDHVVDVRALNIPPAWEPIVGHMLDLDMSVLGADRDEFDVNSANIMAEFLYPGKITLNDYGAGRRAFFAKTLMQPRIFHTPQFHAALERKARMNMIEDLGSTWPIPDVWRTGLTSA